MSGGGDCDCEHVKRRTGDGKEKKNQRNRTKGFGKHLLVWEVFRSVGKRCTPYDSAPHLVHQ